MRDFQARWKSLVLDFSSARLFHSHRAAQICRLRTQPPIGQGIDPLQLAIVQRNSRMKFFNAVGKVLRGGWPQYNYCMARNVVHISEADAISNFANVLAQVRSGAEVVIECDAHAVAVVNPPSDEFRPRLLSESIALAKKHAEETGYEPTLDTEFAADLEAIIKSRRT
jgi:hypothetical protein